jgi:predicted DNA-binding mobile mystery protein A
MKLKNSQLLIVRQLEKKVQSFSVLAKESTPTKGWISSIRKALNMSLRQFGIRMSMSAQGIKDLETREAEGTISLNSLKEAGKALNMNFVYGFVPVSNSIEEMIEARAREMAIKIVKRTATTMSLEDQANSNERLKLAVEEMTQDIKKEVPKSLWD